MLPLFPLRWLRLWLTLQEGWGPGSLDVLPIEPPEVETPHFSMWPLGCVPSILPRHA